VGEAVKGGFARILASAGARGAESVRRSPLRVLR
jgi:hypothetical protein